MQKATATWRQLEDAMLSFLSVELEVGLMFARAARGTEDVGELLHNRRLARKAYDTFEKMIQQNRQVRMTNAVEHDLRNRQRALWNALKTLGEPRLPAVAVAWQYLPIAPGYRTASDQKRRQPMTGR
jgi:hypothetical protein